MVIIDDKNLGNTIITGNIDLSRNIIMYSRDLVLSYIHIGIHTGDEKYRTKSRKPKTFKNITIKKFTERIDSYKVLEVTDDEGAIHLLIGLKFTVIVKNPSSSILNMPYSKSLVFYETNVIYSQ